MRARLTTSMAGPTRSLKVGDEVSGDEAVRLVKAGLAVPIAEAEKRKRTATKQATKKEVRKT